MSFYCTPCDRSFKQDLDLQKHLNNSPRHALHHCTPCHRSFKSESALNQHTRDSAAHAPSFDCEACDQSFDSQAALQQHRDNQHPETPLDAFFRSFPTFAYNSALLPSTSYEKLQAHMGWRPHEAAAKEAWRDYQSALASEVDMWFGAQDDLTAWHALCRAIGIQPLPETCAQGRKAVRMKHVNIIDLIAWGRSDRSQRVQTFRTVETLRAYTQETRRIFSLTRNQRNAVLKHLRRHIF